MDNQPEEKKEIPTPPPSKVNVRTMQSDIQSIQESGGQNPQPYMTEINQPKKETPAPPQEISFQPSELGSDIPGYVGPEEPIFKPGGTVGPLPPQQKPNKPEEIVKLPKKGSKNLIISLAVVILVAVVLGIGYYFSKKQKSVSVTTPEQTTVPPAVSTPPKPEYFSLFEALNVPQAEETITTLSMENINKALTAAASTIPTDTLKEIVLRNTDNSLISSFKITSVLFPELGTEDISGIFEENFAAVVFVDKNGAWPAYVFQLKPDANAEQAQTLIKNKLESSANLKNIFLQESGRAATSFKDGQAGDPSIKTRYLTFSNPLTALNYGWVENKLVITTNYPSLLEVLKDLQ